MERCLNRSDRDFRCIRFAVQDGELVPSDGRLYIQGYNIEDLERGFHGSKFGFEETIYLLLFGELPTRTQFNKFKELMETFRELQEVCS